MYLTVFIKENFTFHLFKGYHVSNTVKKKQIPYRISNVLEMFKQILFANIYMIFPKIMLNIYFKILPETVG